MDWWWGLGDGVLVGAALAATIIILVSCPFINSFNFGNEASDKSKAGSQQRGASLFRGDREALQCCPQNPSEMEMVKCWGERERERPRP